MKEAFFIFVSFFMWLILFVGFVFFSVAFIILLMIGVGSCYELVMYWIGFSV